MVDVLVNVLIVCGITFSACVTLWACISIIVFMIDSFKSYFHKDDDSSNDKK